jgi:transposase
MKTSRRKHSAEFKAKVALAALREQETIPEIARRYGVHANVIYKWKRQLSENVSRAFDAEGPSGGTSERESELLKKIGELTVERAFFWRTGSIGFGEGPSRVRSSRRVAVDAPAVRAPEDQPVEPVLRERVSRH